MKKRILLLSFLLLLSHQVLLAQFMRNLEVTTARGLVVDAYTAANGLVIALKDTLPLFTVEIDDSVVTSAAASANWEGDSIRWSLPQGIAGSVKAEKNFDRGWKGVVTFKNVSERKKTLSGIVPLGESIDRVYIKAAGPSTYIHRLSRSKLFRPGLGAIGVVLPDNAWEMGFCDAPVTASASLAAVARRTESDKADVRRFRTSLEPGSYVKYVFYADEHQGDWRTGARMMFRDRWIYDLESFGDTLFHRKDLEWIRHSYLLLLQFAWDEQYYNAMERKYRFDEFFTRYDELVGGWDAYMIWPTWPRLGLDTRNQWDMYRDLPGGLRELRRQSEFVHKHNSKYFIAYNPWDESTRKEDHLRGMEEMLRSIDGDGVVLDTWGESSKEFQSAVDRVKPGIILYSEGMAVPKDMPGIVAGRVHDAIYMPPPLNLNKLIKPEFAIFRVAQLAEGRIHRESAVAFFNGYGTEMNIMRPGRPDWIEEELSYLGRTTKILRDNSSAFLSRDWVPLLPTLCDSIWVNEWPVKSKTVYTILSLRPEGWDGALFEAPAVEGYHYVSLWNHEELRLVNRGGKTFVPVNVDGFSRSWIGTRREGNVDCVALLPEVLSVTAIQDSIHFEESRGTRVVVWAGMPSYNTHHVEFAPTVRTISIIEALGRHEEKFVIQAFDGNELLDERVVNVPLAIPRLVSHLERTVPAESIPPGMVVIPSGTFTFKPMRSFLSPNEVIPYPGDSTTRRIDVKKFYVDQFPVANEKFKAFLAATRYRPRDTTNFLKHWVKGSPPKGMERHPVVYVNLDDAKAYARWAGKRLPTEIEWQYAAQGNDGRKYPWGNDFDSTRCNSSLGHTTAVDAFPTGESPFGVMDLIGNVWQLTNDVYDNGTFYFTMLRGGSHYNPASSWWYVKGGPQPVDNPQIQLLVSPGFDRSSTVGFRCVKDAQ